MPLNTWSSWGRNPAAQPLAVQPLQWRHLPLPVPPDNLSVLARGMGRSYGDVCLNDGGWLLNTRGLDKFIDFDPEMGRLRCEAGMTLQQVLEWSVPRGWFLPVVPGTQQITVGGAIANDVHGKNHHRLGTFGMHVTAFELLRSDGSRRLCSNIQERDWYQATIGGLGLTGQITWAELQMRRIPGPWIDVETIRFETLDEFFSLSAESDRDFEYSVAWLDGFSGCRGLFMRGNHASRLDPIKFSRPWSVPASCPFLLFPTAMRGFNGVYLAHQRLKKRKARVSYMSYFFPLDILNNWNALYGRAGFFQYQCVVPMAYGRDMMKRFWKIIRMANYFPYLIVLKVFGEVRSPGWLSFPRPGLTLAMDFPNSGLPVMKMMEEMDELVKSCQGALYPAKDARMSPASFRAFFPSAAALVPYRDGRFSSSFWRRVMT